MNIENFTPIITSSVGGFFIGVLLGYFSKKIIKILMFMIGGLIAVLLFLHQQQIISVNMERLEESSAFIFNSLASSLEKMTQIGDTTSLGIPLTASLTAGFTVGFVKS